LHDAILSEIHDKKRTVFKNGGGLIGAA